jgi:tetratricopeptide (TPR) repeat protein
MGNTLFNLKEYEKTIQYYNIALEKKKNISSNNKKYNYLLAPLYYNLGIAYFH